MKDEIGKYISKTCPESTMNPCRVKEKKDTRVNGVRVIQIHLQPPHCEPTQEVGEIRRRKKISDLTFLPGQGGSR